VPLVASTTSHQRDNAIWMAKCGAAVHLPQNQLNPADLGALLRSTSRPQCLTMARAAYDNGKRDANAAIAIILEEVAA
jgi:UDP-N-acetylglucosamine--N-acetylmuramyl-(pentapeptide) pyrophosphoryl-undecaprenol N-acetylglucosamine transferase